MMLEKIKKIILHILNFVSNLVMIVSFVIIIFSSIYLYQLKIQKRDYVNIFSYSILEVKTGSMLPEIKIGDIVLVRLYKENKNEGGAKEKDKIKKGDIITFKNENNKLITHRVVELDENKSGDKDILVTKGDANNTKDDPINRSQVIGRVEKILSNLRNIKKSTTGKDGIYTNDDKSITFLYSIFNRN